MFFSKRRLVAADPYLIKTFLKGNIYELSRYRFRRIKFAVYTRPYDLLPRPAEYATQTAPNTVGGSNTAVKSGRPEAIVFPQIASADNPGCLLSSFYRVVHYKGWGDGVEFDDLSLANPIVIQQTQQHPHLIPLEDLASELFNIVNNVI